jgi:hypothetical protein
MHRLIAIVFTAGALAASVAAVGGGGGAAAPVRVPAAAPVQAVAEGHDHTMPATTAGASKLTRQLAASRVATAKYATNLALAKRDGYQIITRMIPDMGYHFMNMSITGFDVRKPQILVYVRRHGASQLVAFEWVFPRTPAKPPLDGATYGSFPAACHYKDGTFVPEPSQDACPTRSPQTHATFNFWHPDLVTLHVWIWYPNPDGLYHGTNSLIRPFNLG